jgi:hypothetical protein
MSEDRRELPSIVVDTTPIFIKRGFSENIDATIVSADDNDEYRIKIRELEPLKIKLEESFSIVTCYQVVGNQIKKMPWGMTLRDNTITWMPGIGYSGKYRIMLLVKHKNGDVFKKFFDISIEPKFEVKK